MIVYRSRKYKQSKFSYDLRYNDLSQKKKKKKSLIHNHVPKRKHFQIVEPCKSYLNLKILSIFFFKYLYAGCLLSNQRHIYARYAQIL